MTLKQILKDYIWLNIKPKLLELYPDEEENGNLSFYEEVLERLRFMVPVSSDIMLQLTYYEPDDFGGYGYVNVSGKDLNPGLSLPYITDNCAIEFTPWNQWLGMEITEKTLRDFTELEILCHSLYEMTFVDFDEESIQGEMNKLKEIKDEYQNMRKEERKNTRSAEDFLKRLDDEPED